jgi:integrase
MTKIRLQFVQAFVDRKTGKVFHYFRRKGWPRVRLEGIPGSEQFMTQYRQALSATPVAIGASLRSKPGSISAALAGYFDSQNFRSLALGTAVQRKAVLERFRTRHGDKPLASMPRDFVVALVDTMTPHEARNWLAAFRPVVHWALDRKLLRDDPTANIRVKLPKSDGFHTWSEPEIAQFEAHWPIGSKPRLALALGLYTAQRRGDVLKIGRQHIRDGVLAVRQNKTGAALQIPVHPDLAAVIAATPVGHLTLLTTQSGRSYRATDFSDQFRVWCDAAGLPAHCSFHGLRKAALTKLADAGCSVHEIAAISGHKTLKQVEHYTRGADQARLARAAMERVGNTGVKPDPGEVSKPLKPLPKIAEG